MSQNSLPLDAIKLRAGTDTMITSSSGTVRKVLSAVTVDNNSSSTVVVKFFESKDLTSASGTQIGQVKLRPGKTEIPLIVGHAINYSHYLVCTTDAITDGAAVVKVTYDSLAQEE